MNQLSQLRERAKEHYVAMPPATRWLVILLVVVMLGSLLWTLSSIDTASKTFILSDLSSSDISKAEAAFATAQLGDYEIVQGGRIRVPLTQRAAYLNALARADALPTDRDDSREKSLESGLFASFRDQERKHQMYRERALEKLLRKRPQIDDAWVEFDEAQSDGFGEPIRTCCIQVQQAGNLPIDRAILRNIWETAPSYFAGLSLENVKVIDIGSSQTISFGEDLETQNPVLKAKAQWEEFYSQKARRILSNYGNVQLMVDVDLDPRLQQTSETISYDPTNARVETDTIQSEIETSTPETQVDSKERSATHLNEPATLVKRTTRTTESTKREYGQEATTTYTAGLHPTAIRIRVGIPESHYLDVFRQRSTTAGGSAEALTPTEDQLAAIREEVNATVQSAMEGMAAGTTSEQPKVKVFGYADILMPEPPVPSPADSVREWMLQNWQTLALIGLALGCLALVYRMVLGAASQTTVQQAATDSKRAAGALAPASHDDVAAAVIAAETALSDETMSHERQVGDRDRDSLAESELHEQKSRISRLILSHPDAAQATLSSWWQEAA